MEDNIYDRLVRFADFIDGQQESRKVLAEISLSYGQRTKDNVFHVHVWMSVFDFLPQIFENWYFESLRGEPVIDEEEFITTIESVFRWFDIQSIREFCDLFAVNHQSKPGWRVIKEGSELSDLAHNIILYAKERRADG